MGNSAFDLKKLNLFEQKAEVEVITNDSFELTEEDRHKIKLCRRLRTAAMSSQVTVDITEHRHSTNKHLFKFIEMCGVSVKQFVINYLKCVQPYAIAELIDQEFDKDIICMVQLDYRTPIYLKVRVTQFKEVIISFHENQLKRLKVMNKIELPEYSVLFYEEVLKPGNICRCKVPREFSTYNVEIHGVVHNNVIKVKTKELLDMLLYMFNKEIEEQFKMDEMFQFGTIKEVSITSYGDQMLNNVSKLVDYYKTIPEYNVKEISRISSLLVQTLHFVLSDTRCEEYKEALSLRYAKDENAKQILGGATNGQLSI